MPLYMNRLDINIGQLNLQNSRVATTHARKLMENANLQILATQEPYTRKGTVTGFGQGTKPLATRYQTYPTPEDVPVLGWRLNDTEE